MKVILIIALIGLAISTSCDDAKIKKGSEVNAYDTQYCRTLELDEDKYRCCYVVGKTDNGTVRGCIPLTYWDYGHVEDYNFTAEGYSSVDDVEIHCNSKYLTFIASLIGFVFALF